jgi:hypothetical protein
MLLGILGGLDRLALAGFARCRVIDLADVVGLEGKRLALHAVSRERLGLDLAFNDGRHPGLENGGELRQRPQNLNLEPIGIRVLGAATVFPCSRRSSPSGSIKGDVKKKHSSSSARRGYFSDIQPPSADARILAEARLGRTDFAGGCGIINCCVPSRGLIAPSSSVLAIANHGSI